MKITNEFGLPESIARAVERHEHKSETYSVTQLLNPPRIVHLKERHDDEVVEDVVDRIWALRGTAIHSIIEKGQGSQQFAEVYMVHEFNGVKISGTFDLYDPASGTLWDAKETSVWSIIYGSRTEAWTQQLNLYGLMLHREGYEAKHMKIIAFLRDWNKNKAKHDSTYPQHPVIVIGIDVWPRVTQQEFMEHRVALMESTKDTSDENLPFCSDGDRWKDSDKYAVMKQGNVRAKKVFDSPFEAQKHAQELGPNHNVIHRPGLPKRCMEYCPVSQFCNQFLSEGWNESDN